MKNREKGQSLVEMIVALAVAVVVILALVRVTTTSIRNANFAKNRALATKYAQEALEKVRLEKVQNTWQDFTTNNRCEGVSLDPLPVPFAYQPPLDCYQPGTSNNCIDTNNTCEVKATVSWSDAQGTHQSELTTQLTNWE